MLQFLCFFDSHAHTGRMVPILAPFTLYHEIIRVIRHLTFAIHSNAIGSESPSSSLVIKSTIVILSTNMPKLSIVLERVHNTLSFNGMSTLNIQMVRQKKLLDTMKLPATSNRLFRPVILPHPHPHVAPVILLDLLHTRHVRWL
uniref:Uncharacterized protein n=1 Tax=Lotus japonicus TaxID=34305 RepID=I3SD71_LOTJA|nr:unknown [Lotus japonicus]